MLCHTQTVLCHFITHYSHKGSLAHFLKYCISVLWDFSTFKMLLGIQSPKRGWPSSQVPLLFHSRALSFRLALHETLVSKVCIAFDEKPVI